MGEVEVCQANCGLANAVAGAFTFYEGIEG